MLVKLKEFILARGIINWASRLVAIAIAGASLDQALLRFKVDALNILSIDIGHFVLSCLLFSMIGEVWILGSNPPSALAKRKPPSHEFGESIIMYVSYLKLSGKLHTVVDVRNKLTHLFHLLGLNAEREELGKLALEASVLINDKLSKAEILIDDLGWAVYLQGRIQEARTNIQHGIGVMDVEIFTTSREKVRRSLGIAKGHRHLAFLSHEHKEQSRHLQKCYNVIKDIKEDKEVFHLFEDMIVCDEAQLYHAIAYLMAKNIGIENEGVLGINESERIKIARESFGHINHAVLLFSKIHDLEREAKALVLVERLQHALQDKIGVMETKARREMVLSMSGIDGTIATIALTKDRNTKVE